MNDREPHLLAFRDHALRGPEPRAEPETEPRVPTETIGETRPPIPRPAFVEASLAERLSRLRDDPRVVAGAIAVVALVSGVFFYRSALGSGGGSVPAASPESATMAGSGPTSTSAAEVVVHVTGAVAAPGVYRLSPGARVGDAVEAAGGVVEGADPERLNLAALVGDGQRVHVPRAGEPLPEGVTTGGAATGGAVAGGGSAGPINVNLATAEQLEELPGIGPSLASAIVSERERRGGFGSVDDLLSVQGIGEKRMADLRPLVTV